MNGQLVNRPHSLRALTGGRAIKDTGYQVALTSRAVDDRPSISYNLLNLQRKNLFRLPFSQLRQLAFDLSPELKKTLWDFLRYCNPGYIVEGDTDQAERATLEFIEQLSDMHGSFNNLLETSFGNLFRTGRTLKELVLSENAREPIDVYIPDPEIIEFRKLERGARGKVWVLGYQSKQGWVPLEYDGIYYIALDSSPSNPYGESMVNPAIYDSIALLLIKQATIKVLENQGFSRQDYSINTEGLLNLIQEDNNEEEDVSDVVQDERDSTFIKTFIEDVQKELEKKEVDSDYVHMDLIEVNYAPGSLAGDALSSVDSFIHRLQQGVTVGGKSIPLLMADNESLAESQADRSLETYVDGTITPIQNKESDQWSQLFSLANQVRGVRGEVRLLFQKRRVRDLKSIAETEKLQIENIITKLTNNFITQEEAVQQIEMLRDPLIV